MAYGDLGTNSMVYQNKGGGLQVLPLWSASSDGPYRPQWIDQLGNFQLFDWFDGEYIPLAGTHELHGDIIPTQSNFYNLGSPGYRYNYIYTNYFTASGANITNIYSTEITSSAISSSFIYADQITSSAINSTLYDDNRSYTGYAYFDQTTHQLVDGGDIYDLPGFPIYSESVANEFKAHKHYITESIYTGQDLTGNTNTSQMFLRGNDGNDTNPQWTYIVPSYIKSSSSLEPLNGPGLLVIDNTSGYTSGSWITSSVDANNTKIAGIKKGEDVVSFFTVDDALDDTIIDVPHGGTGRDYLEFHAVLIGSGSNDITWALPGAAGQVLISNGPSYDPSFSNLSTLTLTGNCGSIGIYNPTGSNQTLTITPEAICAAGAYHTHSANDIVSGQLAIQRIPTGTSYDTVALGNHTHANLNLTIGDTTVTYDGGYDVDFLITSQSIQDNIGIVPVSHGGTGRDNLDVGYLLVGTGTDIANVIQPGTINYPLVSNGSGAEPSYKILPYQGGGTGISTYALGDIIYYNGTNLVRLPHGDQNQALITNNNVPSWSNLVISSSYAISSSIADLAISSSYADNSLTASYALSVDAAETSSYALEASQSFYSTYANSAERLLTPFKISIHGAATAEAQYVDGQTDVQLNVYELDAHYLYGLAPFDVMPVGTSSTTVAVGDHVHKELSINVQSGTTSTTTTYDGGTIQTVDVNDGTFQLITDSATISQSNNLYHDHTVMYDARGKTIGTVTMPTTITNITVGDQITVKCISDVHNFQFDVTPGSSHTVINRRGETETIYGSYGIDLVFTCIAKTSSACTWVYEKKPVSFN